MCGFHVDIQRWAEIIAFIAPYINSAWVRIFSALLFAGLFALYVPKIETWLKDQWMSFQLSLIGVWYKLPVNKRKTVRYELTVLRTKGVGVRNNAHYLGLELPPTVKEWLGSVDSWNNSVIESIKKYDPSDAEWFKTLDTVPTPRVQYPSNDPIIIKAFREHDYRLKRLDDLIQKYGNMNV